MEDNEQLKPCPFCGAEAVRISIPERSKPFDMPGTTTRVRCSNRECGGKIEKWAARREWAEKSATRAWNNRREKPVALTPGMRLIDADSLRYCARFARTDPDSNNMVAVEAVDRLHIQQAPTVSAVPYDAYAKLETNYKRLLETCGILDAALREYQREYGE